MPVVPFPQGYTPPDPPTYVPTEQGLDILRELTHYFIVQDPTEVVLIPREIQSTGNGASKLVDGPPRERQLVKLIFQASDGIIETTDGRDHQFDFVMVGEYNATIKANDYWVDESGQKYVILGVNPFNGYEVKVSGRSYGPEALHG